MSVLAQVAIDSAKRKFDVDISNEIDRIEKDMNVSEIGYPKFWKHVKDKKIKKKEDKFKQEKINKDLICPMNKLMDIKFEEYRSEDSVLKMEHFFNKFNLEDNNRIKSKKVEDLIQKYSLNLYKSSQDEDDEYLLMRSDFDDLIKEISSMYVSKNYIGLMSWLIDRAFYISGKVIGKKEIINSKTNENKSILLKTLYDINPQNILTIFGKNA